MTEVKRFILGVIAPVVGEDGRWLLEVTKYEEVGQVPRFSPAGTAQASVFKILALSASQLIPTAVETKLEQDLVSEVIQLVSRGGFYFAIGADLFNSLQRQATPSPPADTAYGDDMFCWNLRLIDNYEKMPSALLPTGLTPVMLMQGFVAVNDLPGAEGIEGGRMALISRRSTKRAGIRIHKRGANARGEVANFVETEQILISKSGRVVSFLQTRGSVPAKWGHTKALAYDPPILISGPDSPSQSLIVKAHMARQAALYGAVTVVNLLKEKGRESRLVAAFHAGIKPIEKDMQISYVHFDLNKHSGYNAHSKMGELVGQIEKDVQANGAFVAAPGTVPEATQKGIIRTNCKDSLDRTNIVQTSFGLHFLATQLGLLHNLQTSAVSASLVANVRTVARGLWADNGDHISRHYAGTAAMRQAQTRTGKWSVWGLCQDAANSLTRYYLAYFEDGYRQDGVSVLLGRQADIAALPVRRYGAISAAVAWVFNLFRPGRDAVFGWFGFFYSLGWATAVYFTWTILRLSPAAIVTEPRVVRRKFSPAKL